MKKILIAGGTGLIGHAFIKAYHAQYQISVLTRNKNKAKAQLANMNVIEWQDQAALVQAIKESDVVINLAGENIGDRYWTAKQKKRIVDSRVGATSQLSTLILTHNPSLYLINASAIGIYGLQSSIEGQQTYFYNEDSPLGDMPRDFISEVGQAWEAPLKKAQEQGLKSVQLRFSVVLSKEGGMLKKLWLPFKIGLGGVVGTGRQPLSWIAISDAISIIKLLVEKQSMTGPLNLVADEVVTQRDFAKTFARQLNRPSFMPMPSWLVQLLFGQMGKELLLSGQSVQTNRLQELGYKIQYPTLKEALAHELNMTY